MSNDFVRGSDRESVRDEDPEYTIDSDNERAALRVLVGVGVLFSVMLAVATADWEPLSDIVSDVEPLSLRERLKEIVVER
jgi:hypothetical protein